MSELPFSEACERNREPILAHLRSHFAGATRVLEIGSGTGQHAVHFAPALPHLLWQTSEVPGGLGPVRAWLEAQPSPNLPPPVELDVGGRWPAGPWDGAFSANTLHIMAWSAVEELFAGLARVLAPRAMVAVYGPFNYGGHTSESNRAFDAMLRARDPRSGLREADAVQALAREAALEPVADHAMPANNRLLLWRRAG